MDYFEILKLPRRYALDAAELEARYHAESKLLHPDRHAKADPVVRVKNALATSELNQAYRALRDPVKRAEYLLKLEGIDVADEKTGGVDPEFLMEMMELREQLAEAKAAGERGRIEALGSEMRARRDRAMTDVAAGFARLETGDRAATGTIGEALIALRYYHRFLDEIEAIFDSFAEARQE